MKYHDHEIFPYLSTMKLDFDTILLDVLQDAGAGIFPIAPSSPGDHLREFCAGDAADDAGRLGSLCRLEQHETSLLKDSPSHS